jgi:uncharacterized protein
MEIRMLLAVTPIYAAILAVIYLALSTRVIMGRDANQLAFGEGGLADMTGRVRAHGNFAEYVPFALLLMLVAEIGGTSALWLHLMGLLLVIGRLAHAYALTGGGALAFRIAGVLMTFGALLLGAVLVLV